MLLQLKTRTIGNFILLKKFELAKNYTVDGPNPRSDCFLYNAPTTCIKNDVKKQTYIGTSGEDSANALTDICLEM